MSVSLVWLQWVVVLAPDVDFLGGVILTFKIWLPCLLLDDFLGDLFLWLVAVGEVNLDGDLTRPLVFDVLGGDVSTVVSLKQMAIILYVF